MQIKQPNNQVYLQDILLERHGPRIKKSKKKSTDVDGMISVSSSNESDCEGYIIYILSCFVLLKLFRYFQRQIANR